MSANQFRLRIGCGQHAANIDVRTTTDNREIVRIEETVSTKEKTDIVADGMLTIEEACERSALGRTYLYSLMDKGELKYAKLGRRRLIPRRDLDRVMAANLVTA